MDKIIKTVSNMFMARYGTQLKIETTLPEKKAQPLFLSHWRNSFVYSRTLRQVSFPIFNSKRELQAIAVASPVENKDAIVFDEMAQFLQLTIAEHIELTQQKELQMATEAALLKAHLDDKSNIISLKTKKVMSPPIEWKKRKPPREYDQQPIWLNGAKDSFNSHLAFSIHDWIPNWAFINAKEIPDLIWKDPNNWQNFPQVTIYIPKIETLSLDNLETLKKNLMELRKLKDKKPLIIVSSSGKLTPEVESLQKLFKYYEVKDNISAQVQAHFLLYRHRDVKLWNYQSSKSESVYFLPFSNQSKEIH